MRAQVEIDTKKPIGRLLAPSAGVEDVGGRLRGRGAAATGSGVPGRFGRATSCLACASLGIGGVVVGQGRLQQIPRDGDIRDVLARHDGSHDQR